MPIVLHQPQIPPNTGNIARLCVGTQTILHLIGPLGFSIDDKELKRAGLDYWKDLTCFYHDDFEHFLKNIQPQRMFFYSTKGQRPYTQVIYTADDFLIFGSETQGLPALLLKKYAEHVYTIPMYGPIRSLNLSTAVGIVLYEALRQIKKF